MKYHEIIWNRHQNTPENPPSLCQFWIVWIASIHLIAKTQAPVHLPALETYGRPGRAHSQLATTAQYPWLVLVQRVRDPPGAEETCRSFCQLLPAIPSLFSLQRHELRVLAHHTRATVLDGLVGDGELTQVVANHLLKRETKHWQKFKIWCVRLAHLRRSQAWSPRWCTACHCTHPPRFLSRKRRKPSSFPPLRGTWNILKLPSGQSSLASGWLAL